MEAPSPSRPSDVVANVLRGSRKMSINNEVSRNENGLEDLDKFWNNAVTPRPHSHQPNVTTSKKKKRKKKKGNKNISIESSQGKTPRFSIGGENGDPETHRPLTDFRFQLSRGFNSPGELSHVTTAPPTPPSPKVSPMTSPKISSESATIPISLSIPEPSSLASREPAPLETTEPSPSIPSNTPKPLPQSTLQLSPSRPDLVSELSFASKRPPERTPEGPNVKSIDADMNYFSEEEKYNIDREDEFNSHGDDDEDDLLPPSPPREEDLDSDRVPYQEEEELQQKASSTAEYHQSDNYDSMFEIDNDEDDKEGQGFQIDSPGALSPLIATPDRETLLQRRIETTSMPKMASLSPLGMAAPTSAKMTSPIQGTAKRGSTKKVSSDPEETESPVPERRSAAAKILTSEQVRKTTSVTPNKASPLRRTTARKLEATQKKLESTNMRTPEVSKKRKAKVMFSPPGYPINNREMNPVPVSDFKESPEHGKRRSRRMHVKPLAFWKNERIVYGPHNEKGLLGEMMGSMPVPQNVLTALPTPRKQRKLAPKAARNLKSGIDAQSANHDVKPFDATRLKKKYNFLDGEYAQVWDESIETSTDEKVVSYAASLKDTNLPLPTTGRKKYEGKIVGRAAQSFNVPSSDNNVFVGYLMGNLKLPPKGIKDPESTGACSQVFTVCSCQPNSLEVAFGDPHEEEGSLSPLTAQRFLLSSGDQFRIPPGNAYRLENHSSTTECLMAWTIIRPPKSELMS